MAEAQKEILESIRDIISGKGEDDDILELTEVVNADGSTSKLAPKIKAVEAKPELIPQPPAKTSGNGVLDEIDSLLNEKHQTVDENTELEFRPKIEKMAEKFEIKEEFEPTAPPQEVIAPRSDNNQNQGNETMADDLDSIISGDSAIAAKSALSELTQHLRKDGRETNKIEPSAPFRNGDTVEDLVREALKPMMKDWLDKNLPKLVNEIVQKEIQKLIPRD